MIKIKAIIQVKVHVSTKAKLSQLPHEILICGKATFFEEHLIFSKNTTSEKTTKCFKKRLQALLRRIQTLFAQIACYRLYSIVDIQQHFWKKISR